MLLPSRWIKSSIGMIDKLGGSGGPPIDEPSTLVLNDLGVDVADEVNEVGRKLDDLGGMGGGWSKRKPDLLVLEEDRIGELKDDDLGGRAGSGLSE